MEKKLISLIIAVIMLVSVVPVAAFAADDLPESNGKNQEWIYEAKAGRKSLRITFDDYHGDGDSPIYSNDKVEIYDREGTLRFESLCYNLYGRTIDINSDYIGIGYQTFVNYSDSPCGFKITKIEERSELGKEISVLCNKNGNVTEDRATGTVTFSPVGASIGLDFNVVSNVNWVKHIVVKAPFLRMGCDFNDFVNATSFDLPDGFEIYEDKLNETAFYKNKSNWKNESLYLGTRLLKLGSKDEIKAGTTELCYNSVNHREELIIPNSVKTVDSQSNVKSALCDKGSAVSGLLEETGIKVYFPGSLKIKFTNSVINSGTPLSKAIEVFKLSNKYKWEKITAYSASGYFANKVGQNQSIKITSAGESITFNIVLSDTDNQYINFSDEVLSEEIYSDLGIDKNSIISTDMLGEYGGYISLYNVSDISGLEYAESADEISNFARSFISPKDYFSLQNFNTTRVMSGAIQYSLEYGRLDMEDLGGYAKYTLSDNSIAAIDKDGVITAKNVGETVVTVSVEDLSKTFKIIVYSVDTPTGIKSDKIPSIAAGNLVNTVDGDIYQVVDGEAKAEETGIKVVMSSDHIVGQDFWVYTGYYYLTESSELWVASTRRGSTMKIGDGYKKVCDNSKFVLKNDGSYWDLESRTQLAKNVSDISGNFYITKSGELYGVNNDNNIALVDKKVKSFVDADYSSCFYTKTDGKTYYAQENYKTVGYNVVKCTDKTAIKACYRYSYYYFIDQNNDLYYRRLGGQDQKICSNVIDLNANYYITKDKKVYVADTRREGLDGKRVLDLDNPSLQNVEKITEHFYLDSNHNLYTSAYYNYDIYRTVLSGETLPKFMSNVVDVQEASYYDGNNYIQYAIITRTDGSVWYYNFDYECPMIIIPGNGGKLGDINSDGKINSSDALIVLRHSVGLITLDGDSARRADVNRDSLINSNDALNILRYSVGLINKFDKVRG